MPPRIGASVLIRLVPERLMIRTGRVIAKQYKKKLSPSTFSAGYDIYYFQSDFIGSDYARISVSNRVAITVSVFLPSQAVYLSRNDTVKGLRNARVSSHHKCHDVARGSVFF